MTKKLNHNGALPSHLADEDIISYLDGEMSGVEQEQTGQHLESCWGCRSRLNAAQKSIENFMRLRHETLLPTELPPSGPALAQFRQRLRQHQAARQQKAHAWLGLSRWREGASRFRAQVAHWFDSPLAVRGVVAALALAFVGALVLFYPTPATIVSASELLQRADEARDRQLRNTPQAVAYHKIKVRRAGNAGASAETVNWVTWEDTAQGRFREAVEDVAGRKFIAAQGRAKIHSSEVAAPAVLQDLTQLLRANRMDAQRPLSAASFRAWLSSLAGKQETVTKTATPDGAEVFALHATAPGAGRPGQITEATLTIRAGDWHPLELRLRAKTEQSEHLYELAEEVSEVVSLNKIGPEVFATYQPAAPPAVAANASPGASAELPPAAPSPAAAEAAANPAPANASRPVATAELEIEVLRLLNQANADLGEQIAAKRAPDGTLLVSGIVATEKRKAELLQALSPVAGHPAVRLEIQTVNEAVARQKPAKSANKTAAEDVAVEENSIAAESDLRAYFARQGGNPDEAARRFAAQMVSGSRSATQHLYAMKRLMEQFSPAEQSKLTPEAREKWLSLLRGHARSYQQKAAALRGQLKPVFFAGAAEGGGAGGGSEDLNRAVRQLVAAGLENDGVLRSAFTASGANASFTALKTPQFWQAMKNAEALAAAIQAAK